MIANEENAESQSRAGTRQAVRLLSVLAGQLFFIACAIGLGLLTGISPFSARVPLAQAFVSGVLGAMGLVAVSLLVERLLPDLAARLEDGAVRLIAATGLRLGWPAILSISVAAGVGEELLFRGAIQGWLAAFLPLPLAILIPGLLFAACHPHGTMHMLYVLVIGLGLGVLFAVTGSIVAAIVAHALYDIYALVRIRRRLRGPGPVLAQADTGRSEAPGFDG